MSFIKAFTDLYLPSQSDEFIEKINTIVKTKFYKKNDIIINLREVPSKFYILKEGIVRSFVIDSKGKEHIKTLYKSISLFAPLSSLITKKSSTFIFDCITDCEVLEGNFYDFITLTKSDLEFSNFYTKALENVYISSENKIHNLSVLNATERYLKLKKEIPQIENMIPLYHVASYLNITAVQLSRIRKKLYSKS